MTARNYDTILTVADATGRPNATNISKNKFIPLFIR